MQEGSVWFTAVVRKPPAQRPEQALVDRPRVAPKVPRGQPRQESMEACPGWSLYVPGGQENCVGLVEPDSHQWPARHCACVGELEPTRPLAGHWRTPVPLLGHHELFRA